MPEAYSAIAAMALLGCSRHMPPTTVLSGYQAVTAAARCSPDDPATLRDPPATSRSRLSWSNAVLFVARQPRSPR